MKILDQTDRKDAKIANTNDLKTDSSSKTKVAALLAALVIIVTAALIWKFQDSDDKVGRVNTSFLSNNNQLLCNALDSKLECENLTTGELREFAFPDSFKDASILSASPDGTRLLVVMENQDVVVTNINFEVVRKIFDGTDSRDRFPSFTWAHDANHLLIREIRREQVDADFLPEPIVVNLVNLETGQSRRVYKTGMDFEVESIKILGANSTYLFVSHLTPKNWVAQDTAPPPATLQAIRLTDGLVLPINTHQVNSESIYYDAGDRVFLSLSDVDGNPERNIVAAAQLEETEFGLALRKTFELEADPIAGIEGFTLTSEGILMSNSSQNPSPLRLLQDNGTITDLKLNIENAYDMLLSLQAMPALQ